MHGVLRSITLTVLLCLLSSSSLPAQSPHFDSLRTSLARLTGDTRLPVLCKLSEDLEGILPKEALVYIVEAMEIAQRTGDKHSLASLLASSSFCHTILGDFVLSLQNGNASLALSEELGDKMLIASARSTLGIAYVYVGQYSKALECHLEALRLREELGLDDAATKTLNNIGIVYHNIGQYDKAIEYYKRALARPGTSLDTVRAIRFMHNIGFSELKKGSFEEAMKYHTEALRLAEKIHYVGGLAYTHFIMGSMYAEKKDFVTAINHLQKSLELYRQLTQKPGIADALNGLGSCYFQLGNYGDATKYLLNAAEIAKSINTPKQSMASYEILSSIFEKTGQLDKAYYYYKLYSAARDSIFNSIESNKIAEFSMKLETMKKEREMESLKQAKTVADLDLEKQRNQFNLLVLGVLSLFIIIFILYWYIRNTKKSQSAVQRKNSELELLNSELQAHIGEIRTLSGLLPICSNCKKIRNDRGYWEQLEGYISQHSGATFSHGICPDCMTELYPDVLKQKKTP